MAGQMAGLAGSYTAARAAAEPDKGALYQAQGQPSYAQAVRPTSAVSRPYLNPPAPPPPANKPAMLAPGAGGVGAGVQGLGGSYSQNRAETPDAGGVVPGYAGPQQAQPGAMSLADIQAEMRRQQVGAQLNQNPANSALAGYMMGQ